MIAYFRCWGTPRVIRTLTRIGESTGRVRGDQVFAIRPEGRLVLLLSSSAYALDHFGHLVQGWSVSKG